METELSKSLKKLISDWRSGLSLSNKISPEILDELENHLLEEIDNLRGIGLNDEESFLIATHRIGNTKEIFKEFKKLSENKWAFFNENLISFSKSSILIFNLILFYQSISQLITFLGIENLIPFDRSFFVPLIGLIFLTFLTYFYNNWNKLYRIANKILRIPILLISSILIFTVNMILGTLNSPPLAIHQFVSFYFDHNEMFLSTYITILFATLIIYAVDKNKIGYYNQG